MNKWKIIVIIIFLLVLLTSLMSNKSNNEDGYNISDVKCIGCEACVKVCPKKAISIVGGKAVIDQTKCIQCGICVNGNNSEYAGCPVDAISPPKKDELRNQ